MTTHVRYNDQYAFWKETGPNVGCPERKQQRSRISLHDVAQSDIDKAGAYHRRTAVGVCGL